MNSYDVRTAKVRTLVVASKHFIKDSIVLDEIIEAVALDGYPVRENNRADFIAEVWHEIAQEEQTA
jgi:hypothetical protein